jgi:RHS repeat-associated protein
MDKTDVCLTFNSLTYNGLDTRVGKVDSGGTFTYKRDGVDVTDPVLSDSAASYTPGVSERRSGTSKFYHGERQGSNVAESDASQTTTATKAYDAFGMLSSSSGSSSSPFGFVGQQGYQSDGDSGLKLLGHRYYDASTGRFLTRDPAKDGRNWYDYCENNPVKYVDPRGQWVVLVLIVAAIIYVGVTTIVGIYSSAQRANQNVIELKNIEWMYQNWCKKRDLNVPPEQVNDDRFFSIDGKMHQIIAEEKVKASAGVVDTGWKVNKLKSPYGK